MTSHFENSGVIIYGSANMKDTAVGAGATVNVAHDTGQAGRTGSEEVADRWDIGIVTVIGKEADAIEKEFGLTPVRKAGWYFAVGGVDVANLAVRMVVTRSLEAGQRPTMTALGHLCRHYAPRIVALVGIGGGIHEDVSVGDVVVATRVVYYELRKETPMGTRYRGEERQAPAEIGHAVNRFFTEHGDPAELLTTRMLGDVRSFRVLTGPIGSGEAVIADGNAAIRTYLASYNDKILAVDMESGGLTQYCHENATGFRDPRGWVVLRGISDDANNKDDHYQGIAARNAAVTLRELAPYLIVDRLGSAGNR